MRRKQGTQHLDARYHLMLENAFYQVNPVTVVLVVS
jgi:regulator of nonsense transcripts 2